MIRAVIAIKNGVNPKFLELVKVIDFLVNAKNPLLPNNTGILY